jgi:hypothetical protein
MHKLAISFLMGATAPAVSIYMTGGSNRFMLVFGFMLSAAMIIVPCLVWSDRASNMLAGVDKAKKAFKVHMAGNHTVQAVEDVSVAALDHARYNGWRDDITSALVNLKVSKKRAMELFEEMVREREYGSMEEMLGAALRRAKA